MRDQILTEIQRLADVNGGQPPGSRLFERETGIREAAWRGVYWARWSDAVTEAGIKPNVRNERKETDFIFQKLAEAARHFGKVPTASEIRMYHRIDPEFPNAKTISRHLGSLTGVPDRLADWALTNGNYADVVTILGDRSVAPTSGLSTSSASKEGLVYLIRSGAHFKIGRSDELERRVKEIRIALPETANLVRSIRTDDPAGIEVYWHRRFADRRANGEWFKLSNADVAAFKRRKFQ